MVYPLLTQPGFLYKQLYPFRERLNHVSLERCRAGCDIFNAAARMLARIVPGEAAPGEGGLGGV
jgi:hypothetical protein